MQITAYDDVRWARLTAAHVSNGRRVNWTFGRSAKSDRWYLRAPDGYVRSLETTWADSVPLIRTVLDNHGLKAEVN